MPSYKTRSHALFGASASSLLLLAMLGCFTPVEQSEQGGGSTEDPKKNPCTFTGALVCASSKSQFANSLYDETYVIKERECVASSVDPGPEEIVDTCSFGTVCFVDDHDEDGHVQRNQGEPFCARSITDEDSPYLDYGCDSVFTEFMRYPTSLEVDCRCRLRTVSGSQEFGGSGNTPPDPAMGSREMDDLAHPAGAIPNCAQPSRVDLYTWPVKYGEGPVLSDYNDGDSTWYGAEFDPDKRELYAVILWGNPDHEKTAAIVAWNVDTKDRRIVTGWLPNRIEGLQQFGSGYESPDDFNSNAPGTVPLKWVDNLRLASDGKLYASSEHEIIRVDPDSGARELVWRRQKEEVTGDLTATFGQCFRPDYQGVKDGLQLEKQSFEVGPDLAFYKGFRDARGGIGILKISADAKTCTIISRWGDEGSPDPTGDDSVPPAPDIGTGPPLQRAQVHGMLHHADHLYAVVSNELYRFDLGTGDYRRVDDTSHNALIGHTAMHWDANLGAIWTSGNVAATYGGSVIDPETGQKELIVSDTGAKLYKGRELLRSVYPGGGSAANTGGGATSNNNPTQFGGVIVDPDNPDITYGVTGTGALIKLELSTFNNYIHSWGQH